MIRRARRSWVTHRVVPAAVVVLLLLAPVLSGVRWLVFCCLILLAGVMALDALRNLRCPHCLERRLEPVDRRRAGSRLARCPACGRRWSRSWIGSWEPAAEKFAADSPRATDPWRGGPVIDDTTPTDNTHGRLLQAKQAAQARRPRPRRREFPPDQEAD